MSRAWIFAAVTWTVAACSPPVVPDATQSPLSYAAHVEPVLVERCAACHNPERAEEDLLLDHGAGYEQLVGRASRQVPDRQLVEPFAPDRSYLWQKLDFQAEIGKGMPRTLGGARRLPEAELQLVRRWIEEGALP